MRSKEDCEVQALVRPLNSVLRELKFLAKKEDFSNEFWHSPMLVKSMQIFH